MAGAKVVNRDLHAHRSQLCEQLMGDVQVFLEFFPTFLSVFAEHGQGAFVLAGGQHADGGGVRLQIRRGEVGRQRGLRRQCAETGGDDRGRGRADRQLLDVGG